MKRHLNAIVLVSGIVLLCVTVAAIMSQTLLRKPHGTASSLVEESNPRL